MLDYDEKNINTTGLNIIGKEINKVVTKAKKNQNILLYIGSHGSTFDYNKTIEVSNGEHVDGKHFAEFLQFLTK